VLQLTNLHGDLIATAYLSETATALASTADTSEFGVPAVSAPPKYSWLGAIELPTELPSGVMSMGARSYVPQVGRFLQPDPRPGGSANAYSYTFGDPVNTNDPTGEYTVPTPSWLIQASNERSQITQEEIAARKAAEEAAARAQAEAAAQAALAAAAGTQNAGGEEEWGGEWEEWGEEEGGYEEVTYHPDQGAQTSPLLEEGLLFHAESEGGETARSSWYGSQSLPQCGQHVTGPCLRRICGFPVGCFEDAVNWVSSNSQKIVATATLGLATAVIGGVTIFATTGCAAVAGEDPLIAFDCYKIGTFGATLTVTTAGLTVAAWKHHWSRRRRR
jgi:RHS repeat-associated protein